MVKMQQEYFMYKGYPLVRNGNEIYYGYMSEPYVAWLQILHQNLQDGLEVADKVRVYQMSTDEKLNPMERIANKADRTSLYDALDVAFTWLERANKKD